MKKPVLVKCLALIMSLVILAASLPLTLMSSAEDSTIHLGVISDIHYYPNSLSGNNNQAFKDFNNSRGKEYENNDSLLSNALQGIDTVLSQAREENASFVLIPGDLTKDGELEGHRELAAKLEAFEASSGIQVFVTNGNHDVNNSGACTFENGVQESAEKTSPEQFREIYKNLGYDMADAFYTPEGYPENKGGMLSYAANLGDSFRLIVVDTSKYSADYGSVNGEHHTDGMVSDAQLKWVTDQAKQATANGRTPIVMQHHNMVPHMDIEEATFNAFPLDNWEQVCEAYGDAGIHYVFTGHLHSSDTATHVNDNGEAVTDILTPTLTSYPNYFRTIDMTTDGSKSTLDMTNHDIDDESLGLPKITDDDGTAYERPFKYTRSFDLSFGNNLSDFLERMLGGIIDSTFADIAAAGGLIPYLKTKNIDVEQLLINLIGTNGLSVGNMDILTVKTNAMGLINDIDRQIMDVYVNHPQETMDKLMTLINKLLSYQVSEYPCTYNHELLGTPLTGKGCTLGEFATTALLVYYGGDEDVYGKEGYEYVKDTIDQFNNGSSAEGFFNLLLDVVLHDLVEDEVLANIDLNPGELFPTGTVFNLLGKLLQSVTVALTGGDNSLGNIIGQVLSLDVVPEGYGSIDEILDTLVLDRYLTKSQYESWGATIGWMVKSLIFDENPEEQGDNNISLTYSGACDVEATKDNYRLPNNLNMTLAEDATTSATITWTTKYSVTDTDIELLDYSTDPQFTGNKTNDRRISAKYETVKLSYPGADLGIFGLLPYAKDYIKHTITLTGLTPGAKYSYRVGSASRGWWSDIGTVTTASGGDNAFTFLNITDPQAQQESHYKTYGTVMNAAAELYPDASFTVSNGDQVDLGENMKHWKYFFNSSKAFLNMPFMPTSGNHEDADSVLQNYFNLPNVPEQDTDSGTYYSYDYNNVHFTVLNTNDMTDKKLNDAQIEWLKSDIKNSDADWHIVVLHKALYADGIYYKDKETVNLRNQLAALLPYLGVDLVLEGHNHVYTRTGVMNANVAVPTNTSEETYNGRTYEMKLDPQGTIYSIISSAGVKEYQEADPAACDKYYSRPESIVSNDYPMFSAITVDGDKLYYNAYQVIDGIAMQADSFGISKSENSESVSDKIGADFLDTIFGKLLTELNLKYTWKFTQLVVTVFTPFIKLFSKIF